MIREDDAELLEHMPEQFQILRTAYLNYLKAKEQGKINPIEVAVKETLEEPKV